ncbi:MlaE family ABC transporter permease [Megalodesulfovibrio paquesii]
MQGEFATLVWLINSIYACALGGRRKSRDFYRWQIWRHLVAVGTGSIPIVSVIAACVGIILALQSAAQLERFGATSYVANLVGVIITTELGPLLTAVIATGRSGAAFTAEIATMKISEEIDALHVMGVDPVRFLVWPKLIAMLIMMPVLTVWADFVGILCAGIFSDMALGLRAADYFNQTANFLTLRDFFSGVVKSVGFGMTITIVCCWQGFMAFAGAADVGLRTTKAVVQSIFIIILLDLYFTALNYMYR